MRATLRAGLQVSPERNHCLVSRLKAVVRNSENGSVDGGFVLVKDLNDVAIGPGIQDLKYVRAGGQYAPSRQVNPRSLDRICKCDDGLSIPIAPNCSRCEHCAHEHHTTSVYGSECFHIFVYGLKRLLKSGRS